MQRYPNRFRRAGTAELLFIDSSFVPGPAFFGHLSSASDCQSVRRNIFGDARSCADIGSLAELDGRDQRGVAADENAVLDNGLVLVNAVIVAGDGSSPDVDARADLRVAEVSKVVGLGSLAEPDLLGLDEIADVRAFTDLRCPA